jgi:hypothetical protein
MRPACICTSKLCVQRDVKEKKWLQHRPMGGIGFPLGATSQRALTASHRTTSSPSGAAGLRARTGGPVHPTTIAMATSARPVKKEQVKCQGPIPSMRTRRVRLDCMAAAAEGEGRLWGGEGKGREGRGGA